MYNEALRMNANLSGICKASDNSAFSGVRDIGT
jgi:hypothetical protein